MNLYQKEEGRRKKEEGKIFGCLSFNILIFPNLSLDCYKIGENLGVLLP
ncbi:MAG: hypothetical protein F6K24_17585 [Okeania sp. SIO2D1]|nr:hypothetical protein [Okeania sp. SIO2D1]